MSQKCKAVSAILPAGTYWIGDPCYAVPNHQWDYVLQQTDYFGCGGFGTKNTEPQGVYQVNGFALCAFNTMYGDGGYFDQAGREYGVDSGSIGAVDVRYADRVVNGCHKFTFPTDVVASIDENGVIRIGDIEINTGDWEDDGDDDEYWEDDGDDDE